MVKIMPDRQLLSEMVCHQFWTSPGRAVRLMPRNSVWTLKDVPPTKWMVTALDPY